MQLLRWFWLGFCCRPHTPGRPESPSRPFKSRIPTRGLRPGSLGKIRKSSTVSIRRSSIPGTILQSPWLFSTKRRRNLTRRTTGVLPGSARRPAWGNPTTPFPSSKGPEPPKRAPGKSLSGIPRPSGRCGSPMATWRTWAPPIWF